MKSRRGYIFTAVCVWSVCQWTKFQPNDCTKLDAFFAKLLLAALAQTPLKFVTLGERSRSAMLTFTLQAPFDAQLKKKSEKYYCARTWICTQRQGGRGNLYESFLYVLLMWIRRILALHRRWFRSSWCWESVSYKQIPSMQSVNGEE